MINFKQELGDVVEYPLGNEAATGIVTGFYKYKDEPSQALVEYISKDGTVCTLWRNEEDFYVVE